MSNYIWFWRGETYNGKTALPEQTVGMKLEDRGGEKLLKINVPHDDKYEKTIQKGMEETEVGYLRLLDELTLMEEWEFVDIKIVDHKPETGEEKYIVSFSDITFINGHIEPNEAVRKHKNYWLDEAAL